MNTITDWLNSSLTEIKHESFKDVIKIELAQKKAMDDGQVVLFSDLKRVTLTLVMSNGERKKIKAVAKTEAPSGAGKDLASTFDIFTREIKMYSDVLKFMEMVMAENGVKETLWAACYHCGDNKILLQDLSEDGYKIVPTQEFLDIEHGLIAMKAIGKYHALTFATKERYCFDSSHFEKPPYAKKIPVMDSVHSRSIETLCKTMNEKWGPEWKSVSERLMKYFENPGDLLYSAWKDSKGKWDVLNHGDFTIRNLMFHYPPGSTHPDDIKFLDFQMCHYSNLASDLVTLLYTSLRPNVREKNMGLLLNAYVNSLTSTSKLLGHSGPLPTVEDVLSSIRCLSPLMFSQIIINVPFFIMSGKQDIQKIADEYCDKYSSFDDIMKSPKDEGKLDTVNSFDDEDVMEFLKYELKRCIDEHIF